jgi:hypothetical protein
MTAHGRLMTGSRIMSAQFRAWLGAGDLTTDKGKPLTGMPLVKARAGRAGSSFVLAWFFGGLLYATGLILWGTIGLWLLAALVASAGIEKPEAPAPEKPEQPEAEPGPAYHAERVLLLEALDEITAHTGNIHLWDLWEQLRTRRPYADLGDKQLRALLVHYGVPIHQSVTAGRVKGRSGVKRADIEALTRPAPPPLSAPPLDEEELADLEDSSSSFPGREGPKGDDDLGADTLAMLSGEVSTR